MPEIPTLPPIASAPISVVLLVDRPSSHPEELIANWVTFLNGLDRDYEILLADAGAGSFAAAALTTRFSRLKVVPGDGPMKGIDNSGASSKSPLRASLHLSPSPPRTPGPEGGASASLSPSPPGTPGGEGRGEGGQIFCETPPPHPQPLSPEHGSRAITTRHPGVGTALQAAFAEASHPLLFYVSCAEKYRPAELGKLIRQIDTVHLVGGYRAGRPVPTGWRLLGASWRGLNHWVFGIQKLPLPGWLGWRRHLGAWLAKLFFGVGYRDPGCPCRLLRREILARMPIQSSGSFAHVEILAKANFLGCLLGEEIPLGDPQKPVAADEPTPPLGELLREARRLFHHPDFGPPPVPPAPPAPPAPPPDPNMLPEPPAVPS